MKDDFLRAIADDPDDEHLRLVFSDFLEQQGDSASAEAMRTNGATIAKLLALGVDPEKLERMKVRAGRETVAVPTLTSRFKESLSIRLAWGGRLFRVRFRPPYGQDFVVKERRGPRWRNVCHAYGGVARFYIAADMDVVHFVASMEAGFDSLLLQSWRENGKCALCGQSLSWTETGLGPVCSANLPR